MTALLHSERIGSTALWTIDRPQARNAVDADVVAGLDAAVSEAERDHTLRAVVLTGAGEVAFSAGADLKLLSAGPRALRSSLDTRLLALLGRIEALPVPVIAVLNGAALGGGHQGGAGAPVRLAAGAGTAGAV